ncbi:lactose/L-arabinose transport system substrate-binding protein [Enterococcus sp. AZ194]|uniref:ABC transporter substrate-binding protein n=1 Tax=Enterococcus sp. AZ194 TaxID=2774629 RepID=UPI003F28B4A3
MKLKKMLGSALGLLLIASLAACGGGDSKGASKSADSAKDLAKEERVEKASIEVYMPKGKNTDYLQKSIELYNKKYNTELELKPVDVAPAIPMVQKVTPKLVANEKMPDLIFLQDSNAGSVFEKFEDLFYSSEDFGFVKDYGKDFYKAKMNMLENIAPSKKVYGFPNDWGNASMFYNEAAFKEAGVDMTTVKTWDELIDAGKKLKEKTGKKLLFMRDTGELDLVKYLTEQQGVSLFDKEGNLNLLNDAVKKSYEIIQKLQDEDLVAYGNSKDYTVIGQDCGTIFAGGWLASYQEGDYPDDKGNWRIGAIPAVNPDENFAPMSGGSSYYVPKKSDNALAALQFITFALTDKEALDSYMELSGLPANTKAYESEAAQKEFPYYGNQKILVTLDEISKNSVEGYAFPYSADLDNYIEAASYEIKNNGVSVEDALKKQADDFASKYNVKVNE